MQNFITPGLPLLGEKYVALRLDQNHLILSLPAVKKLWHLLPSLFYFHDSLMVWGKTNFISYMITFTVKCRLSRNNIGDYNINESGKYQFEWAWNGTLKFCLGSQKYQKVAEYNKCINSIPKEEQCHIRWKNVKPDNKIKQKFYK